MLCPPPKGLIASAGLWLSNVRDHFEVHCADLPPEARRTRFLGGGWPLFRTLEAHVRDRVLDDYLRKHCKCRRWLYLVFASRHPYLADMGRLVRQLSRPRSASRPLGHVPGPSTKPQALHPSGTLSTSNIQNPSRAHDLDDKTSVNPSSPAQVRARMARISMESIRRYLLAPDVRERPRSDPMGPLSGQDLSTLEDLLKIADALAMSDRSNRDAVTASLAGRDWIELELEMDDVWSVDDGTGGGRAGEESTVRPVLQELYPGPSMRRDMPEDQQQPSAGSCEKDHPKSLHECDPQVWRAEAENRALHAHHQLAAPHRHSAPPSTTRTPESRLMDRPQAKTTGKRRRGSDQTSDRPGKRRRTTERHSWIKWLSSAIFGGKQEEQVEAADELRSSDAETENALGSPRRPLWAGTPVGDVLRLRDLRDRDDDGFYDDSLVSRCATTPAELARERASGERPRADLPLPSARVQAAEGESQTSTPQALDSKAQEPAGSLPPSSGSDDKSSSYDPVASFIARKVRSPAPSLERSSPSDLSRIDAPALISKPEREPVVDLNTIAIVIALPTRP
ncbi:hypothetical protein HRG_010961 [Hirsutella rhossiliensis]|uniref:Uncharacterized protein n=1 Tax=Hirsutella rhossiliensis TaxID=111463 RepID=A0A9P8MK90_9HYPO|nr:uncharacterized protein HRG_10961 [Hirsutella rhossiliensis]KAH0957868.1 hypothetical protein HRG_10961 [Hirsutella rhossiliensis]